MIACDVRVTAKECWSRYE